MEELAIMTFPSCQAINLHAASDRIDDSAIHESWPPVIFEAISPQMGLHFFHILVSNEHFHGFGHDEYLVTI
jgi:hypothetical protein